MEPLIESIGRILLHIALEVHKIREVTRELTPRFAVGDVGHVELVEELCNLGGTIVRVSSVRLSQGIHPRRERSPGVISPQRSRQLGPHDTAWSDPLRLVHWVERWNCLKFIVIIPNDESPLCGRIPVRAPITMSVDGPHVGVMHVVVQDSISALCEVRAHVANVMEYSRP